MKCEAALKLREMKRNSKLDKTKFHNHKITSIKTVRYDKAVPVYDINVDKYHNFLLDAGVVTHNSGLHGIGISATNALSSKLVVQVFRGKKIHQQEYSEGKTQTELEVVGKTKKTGTQVYFEPDFSIFSAKVYKDKILKDRFFELSFLNPGLTIEFTNEIKDNETVVYHHEKGLLDFITFINKNKEPLHDPIYIKKTVDDCEFELVFQYNNGYSDVLYSFANNINTIEGGTHLNAAKGALLKYLREYITKNKMLKGTNLELLPKDVLEGLTLIISIKLPEPEFESQTKIKLNNTEIRSSIEESILEESDSFKIPDEVYEKIVSSIMVRDATKKARKLVKRKGLLDTSLPGKLADCSENNPEKCELFIVEGQSAAGCVFHDTKIITKNGVKQIDEIQKDEEVLTHTGEYKKVKNAFTTNKKSRVRMMVNGTELIASSDHPVLVKRENRLEWIQIGSLESTDLLVKLIKL